MTETILVRGARQLVTLRGPAGPRRGTALRELNIIENGAVLVRDGVIVDVGQGRRVENLAAARHAHEIDASGQVVLPGFVDCHTHLAGGPPRAGEKPSLTPPAVRLAPAAALERQAREHQAIFVRQGVPTVEVKSSSGLDQANDAKSLRVLGRLATSTLDVAPTYLGLRAVPADFEGGPGEYTAWVIAAVLPALARRRLARYADVCHGHTGFAGSDVRQFLEAARRVGLGIKVHGEHPPRAGAVRLAAEMQAVSVDGSHFADKEDAELLARCSTIAVLLPGPAFHLHLGQYPPARLLVDRGAAPALATDFTPGSPGCDMLRVLTLACSRMRLSPAEAISAATINSAHAAGLGRSVGSIEPGKQADLIFFDAPDYREIPYHLGLSMVSMTMKRGVVLYRRGEVRWPEG